MTDAVGSIRNISGDDRTVPALGGRLVLAGQAVPVPLDEVTGFTQQEATWAPHDEAAQAVHDAMLKSLAALRDAELEDARLAAEAEALTNAERQAAWAAQSKAEAEAEAARYAAVIDRAKTAQQRVDLVFVGAEGLVSALLADELASKTPRTSVIEAAESRITELNDAQEG